MSAAWFIGFSFVWTAGLVGVASLLMRGQVSARFAHNFWRGVAILTLLPWLIVGVSALIPTPNGSPIPDVPYLGSAVGAISETPAVQAAARTATDPVLGIWLWGLLVAGWAVRAGSNALGQVRLQRIKQSAEPAASLSAAPWANRLGLNFVPNVSLIDGGSPFLAGLRARTIYLPQAVSDPIHANVIFAHECTHVARGDLITRPFERMVADIFWFSPFAWMIRRQLDYWREAACDEQTASLTGDSVGYARALANTARLTRPAPRYDLPVAAFILPQRETLKRRLTQLLETSDPKPRRHVAALALVAGLILAPLSLAQGMSLVDSSMFSHAVITDSQAVVTSSFGKHVYPDKEWWHSGVDIKTPKYTYVHVPADAQVLYAGEKDEFGKTVDVKFADGRKMRFAQLAHIMVKKGDWLKAGDKVGKAGAPDVHPEKYHLHLEIYQDGEHRDPETVRGLTLIKS